MNKLAAATAYSKLSSKSQTVVPKAIRDALQVGPGDTLRYRLTEAGVLIDKSRAAEGDDPFAAFTEWAGAADDEAYADL